MMLENEHLLIMSNISHFSVVFLRDLDCRHVIWILWQTTADLKLQEEPTLCYWECNFFAVMPASVSNGYKFENSYKVFFCSFLIMPVTNIVVFGQINIRLCERWNSILDLYRLHAWSTGGKRKSCPCNFVGSISRIKITVGFIGRFLSQLYGNIVFIISFCMDLS